MAKACFKAYSYLRGLCKTGQVFSGTFEGKTCAWRRSARVGCPTICHSSLLARLGIADSSAALGVGMTRWGRSIYGYELGFVDVQLTIQISTHVHGQTTPPSIMVRRPNADE